MKLDNVTNSTKSNISEAGKVQVDCLEDSESDSYDKNSMKEKANELVRLHEAMQKKLKTASYSEQIQILTLVPNKWSRKYCSVYVNVFEYPVWTAHEIKKVDGILAKPALRKGKISTNETLHLVTTVYKDDNSARRCLERKTMLVWVKEYINKNFVLAKIFVTCKNYILLSKKSTQM